MFGDKIYATYDDVCRYFQEHHAQLLRALTEVVERCKCNAELFLRWTDICKPDLHWGLVSLLYLYTALPPRDPMRLVWLASYAIGLDLPEPCIALALWRKNRYDPMI
jgi:hypothetical protein